MYNAAVSLGSNLGNRKDYLARALEMLSSLPHTKLLVASSVSETDPVGVPDEFISYKFLNQVAVFETELDAVEFSNRMHLIEDALGRVRTVRNGPRVIDVDLIAFDNLIINDPFLTLPHPRAHERDFVMRPLRECIDALSVADSSWKTRFGILFQTDNRG